MKENLWLTLVTCPAYCVDKDLWKAIDYLKEQVRVLKEQQAKDKCIPLDNRQRIRLVAKAKRLTRKLMEETSVLFTPDTILGWYRRLIAQKYDGGKKHLIHDRDPLYTDKLDSILKAVDVDPVKLPPRSPNLNAHADRFVRSVRSVKEECLDHCILSSEDHLRYVLSEYLKYYHHERIHQGLNRIIEPQHEGYQGEIVCIERLGRLLRSYHRKAA